MDGTHPKVLYEPRPSMNEYQFIDLECKTYYLDYVLWSNSLNLSRCSRILYTLDIGL